MKTIFVDMDGVLCDFDKRYAEFFGVTTREVRHNKSRKEYRRLWNDFIDRDGFATLDLYPGATQLIEWLNRQKAEKCILSSSGGMERHNDVVAQKIKWLCSHGITWPTAIVPGRKFKAGFAGIDNALIDDHPENVEQFTKSGGFGILHESDRKWNTTYQLELWLEGKHEVVW